MQEAQNDVADRRRTVL